MAKFVNRAKMSTATTGTGTLTLGSAVAGYQSFTDAGVVDADVVRYVIEDGDAWEIGTGTYSAGTLTRAVEESSNADAALNLGGDALVFVTVAAGDLQELISFSETFGLPTTDGTAGQVMTTDGSGNLSLQDLPPSGPTLEAVASGTLPDGSTVVVNADGTVSVVEETVFSFNAGSVSQFNNNARRTTSVFDSNENKVVVSFQDRDQVNLGASIVGTLSGTSISFGSINYFSGSGIDYLTSTFDSNSNKVIIAYQDQNNNFYGTAIVGTVSGTSISFGSPVVFISSNVQPNSAVFDNNANKVVIAFRDAGNSSYGKTVVGTVSGTSISFGSPQTFESAASQNIRMVFESGLNQIIIAYVDQGNADRGTFKVGPISGTSLSLGGPLTFSTGSVGSLNSVFDENSNKVIFAFKDVNNSGYGTALVGEVTSSSVTFGSPIIFESAEVNDIAIAYDSFLYKNIISYKSGSPTVGKAISGEVTDSNISFNTSINFTNGITPDYITSVYDTNEKKVVTTFIQQSQAPTPGNYVVIQAPGSLTNLTEENFTGFSDGTFTNTQTATIQLVGSVADGQSGLTPAQKYYVQGDGTLDLTPATPSVYAGLAVGTDKLIVKG